MSARFTIYLKFDFTFTGVHFNRQRRGRARDRRKGQGREERREEGGKLKGGKGPQYFSQIYANGDVPFSANN